MVEGYERVMKNFWSYYRSTKLAEKLKGKGIITHQKRNQMRIITDLHEPVLVRIRILIDLDDPILQY